ncbi:MAG TPA: HAMP domain-containing sensor histidine kinase [Ignavibacteriaceae bacterium]|nr:HAMP domain-containing sensor histidine kinase [Ignavibacteriaceae bacterium]
MIKTIKTKLIFFSIIFIILSTGIPIYILIQQFRENFNQRSVVMLDTTLEMLRYGLKISMLNQDKNVQSVVDSISSSKIVDHIRIFDSEGTVLYSSNHNEINKSLAVIAPDHIDRKNIQQKNIKLVTELGLYSVTEPILNEKECHTCHQSGHTIAYLDIDTDLTKAETVFYTGSNHMFFLAIAGMIVLGISIYLMFNYLINRPLKKLITAMDKVESVNYDVKLFESKQDEIGSVYNHFNNMISKLKSSKEKIEELHFERLQRVNRLKTLGELTSQMAHEINNHTAIIMSHADYLELESNKKQNLKDYSEDFNIILDQANKLSLITGNILRHSKKSKNIFERVNLVDVINRSMQLLNPSLKKKNIKFDLSLKVNNALIFADPLQMEQVLINLVNNSIDALDINGQIKIELSDNPGSGFRLTVADNGCGIEKENIDQIFSAFYTSKDQEKGTGLGLYIVKNICDNHNIIIGCESEPGKGSKFTLKFNRHEI